MFVFEIFGGELEIIPSDIIDLTGFTDMTYTFALPFVLAFAAGAMIYVVVEELIPEFQREPHSNTGTIGLALGFALMMLLDVALG